MCARSYQKTTHTTSLIIMKKQSKVDFFLSRLAQHFASSLYLHWSIHTYKALPWTRSKEQHKQAFRLHLYSSQLWMLPLPDMQFNPWVIKAFTASCVGLKTKILKDPCRVMRLNVYSPQLNISLEKERVASTSVYGNTEPAKQSQLLTHAGLWPQFTT